MSSFIETLAGRVVIGLGALGIVAAVGGTPASAAMLTLNFGGTEYSGSGGDTSNDAFLTITITDNVSGGVTIASSSNSLANGEFVDELYLNINPYESSTCSGYSGPTGSSAPTCTFSSNGNKADGASRKFDLKIEFDNSPPEDRIGAGDSFSLTIADITASQFNDFAEGQGFLAAVHVQGLSGGKSGFFTPTSGGGGDIILPEPATLSLLGLGLVGIAAFRRRSAR